MQQTVVDNRYTLVETLGDGGMAKVYLAHDEVLDRDVALKVLKHQYTDDEEFVERFRREARSAAGLSHPNIVSVYDQGRSEDDAYYIAMEYVPRGTLKDGIERDGALAPEAAVGVALQIADALQAAHEKGVIHRDIKPQNVLVTSAGDVKVTDFGIARAASSPLTATSTVLGTAGYMSPEQAMGDAAGPQSDLYSLGVVLYEMLTGALPHTGESPVAQAMKHVNEHPRSPREANPEVSGALDALTMKLLAKDPEERYASATALASDLERVRNGLPPAAVGAEKTTPLPTAPEERTKPIVRPPAAVPARVPKRGGRPQGGLFSILAALLLAAAVLGDLWALQNFGIPSLENSGDQSEAENTTPMVQVPDLYWSTTAETDLANEGLRLGNRYTASSDAVPANVVIYSDPAEGTEVEQDTVVDIYVSTGPQQPPPVQAPIQNPNIQQAAPAQPQLTQPAQPQFGGDDNNEEEEKKEK